MTDKYDKDKIASIELANDWLHSAVFKWPAYGVEIRKLARGCLAYHELKARAAFERKQREEGEQ